MTSRERWTVYPLLFLALGMQFRNKVVGIEAKVVQCESLMIANQNGKPVARLHATALNRGQLEFLDTDGKVLLLAGTTADAKSVVLANTMQCEAVKVTGSDAKPAAAIYAAKGNHGRLELYDGNGKAVLIAGSTTESKAGLLQVQNPTHAEGVAIVAGTNELGGHIEAFSPSGSVAFRMIPEGKVLTLSAIDPKTNIRTVWVPQIVQQISSPKTSSDDRDKGDSKSKEPKSEQEKSTEAEASEVKENE
jgi:hypothetical protein